MKCDANHKDMGYISKTSGEEELFTLKMSEWVGAFYVTKIYEIEDRMREW